MKHVFISSAWLDQTRIDKNKLGDAIGEELHGLTVAAKQGYLALKQNFDDLGDYESASWAYCKERRMEKLGARENGRVGLKAKKWNKAITGYSKFASDTMVEWLCDYGESFQRVLLWMLILTFIVGPLLLLGSVGKSGMQASSKHTILYHLSGYESGFAIPSS